MFCRRPFGMHLVPRDSGRAAEEVQFKVFVDVAERSFSLTSFAEGQQDSLV